MDGTGWNIFIILCLVAIGAAALLLLFPPKWQKKHEQDDISDTKQPDASDDEAIIDELKPIFQADDDPAPWEERDEAKEKNLPSEFPTRNEASPPHHIVRQEKTHCFPNLYLLKEKEQKNEGFFHEEDTNTARLLQEMLDSFGIQTRLVGITHGPTVTRFEFQPAPGVRVKYITSLANDISLKLAKENIRIEAPIPGKAAVGIEIPNKEREFVSMREALTSTEATRNSFKIAIDLGKAVTGHFVVEDLVKMTHVIIMGQSDTGKSECLKSWVMSMLFRCSPAEVKMILINTKDLNLFAYNGLPHLIYPVVTQHRRAIRTLEWATEQMRSRYKTFAECGVRDIESFNERMQSGEKIMPRIVIFIDEIADFVMFAPGEVKSCVYRLTQSGADAGIHLVIATQRPSKDVIPPEVLSGIQTKISFAIASSETNKSIIGYGGAEKLLGRGDMLFVPSGMKPIRVQGVWVADEEVEAVVEFIKERSEPTYDQDMVEQINNSVLSDAEKEEVSNEYDPRLPEAVEIVLEAGQASISMLQRRMRIGYARAGRLIDEMSLRGLVSEADGAKPRQVLITREEFERMFEEEE